jgi:hypothetical protein
MEDPKEEQVRKLSEVLTGQQLLQFGEAFPEFSHLSDTPALRRVVSLSLLFSAGAFEADVYLLSRIDTFRSLCSELLRDEANDSDLFSWVATVATGKKGADNLDKFLLIFQKFLKEKLDFLTFIQDDSEGKQSKLLSTSPRFFSAVPSAPASVKLLTVQSITKLKELIPVLELLDSKNNSYLKLFTLLHEMTEVQNRPELKYFFLHKILKVGNLFEILIPDFNFGESVEQDCSVSVLDSGENVVSLKSLKRAQQYAVFSVARNISADHSHLLFEDQIADLINNFLSALQKGVCIPGVLVKYCALGTDACRSDRPKGLKAYFFIDQKSSLMEIKEKTSRANKLLCQAGYFMLRARDFLANNDLDSACMALINAGTCGRDFKKAGLNKGAESVMHFLSTVRNKLSHTLAADVDVKKLSELLGGINVEGYVKKLEKESKDMGYDIDVSAYYKDRNDKDDPQSPRAYNRSRFSSKK